MRRCKLRSAILIFLLFFIGVSGVFAVPVNLNDFTADPTGNVTISADGSNAVFTEDGMFTPISLSTFPLTLPGNTQYLVFDYVLDVTVGGKDYFDFYLDDLSKPMFSDGGTDGKYSASTSINVSSFSGSVDVIFSFLADFGDQTFNSMLTISNVQLVERQVPAPASMLLMLAGLMGLTLTGKKTKAKIKKE